LDHEGAGEEVMNGALVLAEGHHQGTDRRQDSEEAFHEVPEDGAAEADGLCRGVDNPQAHHQLAGAAAEDAPGADVVEELEDGKAQGELQQLSLPLS
jgi:hypothetical protein